jgi:chromatin segregation and condensation protein Rec8/ScpA/Scc1 (kleisin family)
MRRLSDTLELVRSQMVELADVLLGELFVQLAELDDVDTLSLELVAGTWLMRMKMHWLLDQDDDEVIEDEELDRALEGILLGLVEKAIYASASKAMRTRLEATAATLPVSLEASELVEDRDSSVVFASSELGEAIARALARALARASASAEAGPTPLERSSVDVVAIGLNFLARLERMSSFSAMIAGASGVEVIVSFVILLEAHAFGAIGLAQVGDDIEVAVLDAGRLGLVTEMVRTLG